MGKTKRKSRKRKKKQRQDNPAKIDQNTLKWSETGTLEESLEPVLDMSQLPGEIARQREEFLNPLKESIILEKDPENPQIIRVVSSYRDDILPFGGFPSVITRLLVYELFTAQETVYFGFYTTTHDLEKVLDVVFKMIPWIEEVGQEYELLSEDEELVSVRQFHEKIELVEGGIPESQILDKPKSLIFFPLLSEIRVDGKITQKAAELQEKRE